jgi:hypothetical protein
MRRRVRARAVRVVRRSGLLPANWPDRLGEEARFAGASLPQTCLVFFPDTRSKLYQLRQWYGPLRALDREHPVVVLGQDSRAMAAVRAESGLTAVTLVKSDFVADLLTRSEVKVVLYVNHSSQNFAMLRFPWLAHVYLSHGDSDKGVSVSNQVKAYDFCMVAGQAAIDRLANRLLFADMTTRCLTVGRPELDAVDLSGPVRSSSRRPRVLYAPTWEGGDPSMAYGSLVTHGLPMVQELLDSRRFAVTYRPHPLSGFRDRVYGAADVRLRELVTKAAREDPSTGHRVDSGRSMLEAFREADVLVCDVSSVATDWLPTGRPLIVTRSPSSDVAVVRTRLLDLVPRLDVHEVPKVTELVAAQLEDDPMSAERRSLVDYYLGDTTPGAATRRFVDAVAFVVASRDKAIAERSPESAEGPGA